MVDMSNGDYIITVLLSYTLGFLWAKCPDTGNRGLEIGRFVTLGVILLGFLLITYRG